MEQHPTSSGSIRQTCSAISEHGNGAMRLKGDREQREKRARRRGEVEKKRLRDLLG